MPLLGHQGHLFQNLLEDRRQFETKPEPWAPRTGQWGQLTLFKWDPMSVSRNTRLPSLLLQGKLSLYCFKVLHRILATSFSIIHPSTLPSGIFLFYKCLSCYSLRQLNLKFAILGNLLFLMLSSLNSDSVVWNRLQPGFLLPSWISGGLSFPCLLWVYFSASHWWLPRVSSNHSSHCIR